MRTATMAGRRGPDRVGVASLATGLALLVLGGTWAAVVPTAEPAAPIVLRAGCPAVLPGTSSALDDYADLVVWQGRSYLQAADPPGPAGLRLGPVVTTVGCSLADPSATEGQRVAPGPWPDGTATGLPTGTRIHAVRGRDPSCLLAVARDPEVVAYVAVDLAGDGGPLC
jgi:hypothetical protein